MVNPITLFINLAGRIPYIRSAKALQTVVCAMAAMWVLEKFRPHSLSLGDKWFSAFFDAMIWNAIFFIYLFYVVREYGQKVKTHVPEKSESDTKD